MLSEETLKTNQGKEIHLHGGQKTVTESDKAGEAGGERTMGQSSRERPDHQLHLQLRDAYNGDRGEKDP